MLAILNLGFKNRCNQSSFSARKPNQKSWKKPSYFKALTCLKYEMKWPSSSYCSSDEKNVHNQANKYKTYEHLKGKHIHLSNGSLEKHKSNVECEQPHTYKTHSLVTFFTTTGKPVDLRLSRGTYDRILRQQQPCPCHSRHCVDATFVPDHSISIGSHSR